MTHRALIIGCGRMGAARDNASPWLYDHPSAYRVLRDRVELVGFVDRVLPRAEWAAAEWGVPFAGDYIVGALRELRPDIVSICTPPSDRLECLEACEAAGVAGIWCEKPYALGFLPKARVQVNYIRRFDPRHRAIADRRRAEPGPATLIAIAANDIHTTCHFTDLARWWGIVDLRYIPFHGPSTYILREPGSTAGRYAGWRDEIFTGGGVESGFMEAALDNLLNAVEGHQELRSPAENAIESEKWADEIIRSA